jgi:surface antigen
MLMFTEAPLPQLNPLISVIIEQQTEQEVAPSYTIDEKIALNYYNCNEAVEFIRADNAQCLPKPARRVNTRLNTQSAVRTPQNGSNGYSYGYCTHFVKEYTGWVPNGWGNANRWASNARSQGYTVSNTPVIGAVAQTSSGRLGHVAVVTGIGDGTVTVIEKNYNGWNVVSTRTVSVDSFVYIY